jgi:hypothetical protein
MAREYSQSDSSNFRELWTKGRSADHIEGVRPPDVPYEHLDQGSQYVNAKLPYRPPTLVTYGPTGDHRF